MIAVAALVGALLLEAAPSGPASAHPATGACGVGRSDAARRPTAKTARGREAALQAQSVERERQAYYSARGNLAALRQYVETCTSCPFESEARTEIRKLAAADEDERMYQQSRGKLYALHAYLNACDVCAFKSAALDEIASLERREQAQRQSPGISTGPQFTLYRHYDLPGNDILPLEGGKLSLEACAAACAGSKECDAYTHDRWNNACYLKRNIGTLALNPKATTGIRKDLPAPRVSRKQREFDPTGASDSRRRIAARLRIVHCRPASRPAAPKTFAWLTRS